MTTEIPIIARCEDADGTPPGAVYYFHNSGRCASRGQWGADYQRVGTWKSWDGEGRLTKGEVFEADLKD